MPDMKRSAAMRREFTAAQHIPYSAHVSSRVIRTAYGDYLQGFRLGGASFECRDDAELNNWHERLNVLWRNIASPNVALWTHIIRHRASIAELPRNQAARERNDCRFADELDARYEHRLRNETLMLNELYLAVLYRPIAGVAPTLLSRLLAQSQQHGARGELEDSLDACEKLSQTLMASLARYEPEPLECYRHGGIACSSLLEYLGLLINGERQRIPLPRGPLNQVLASARLFFGTEAIEYRSPSHTRVGAMLGIKEYPTPTIVENCGTTLILRCSGSENGGTAQFASRLIGEREIVRRQVTRGSDREAAFAARGGRRSKNISEQHVTEAAVMPSEIEQLPDLSGYLKRASSRTWLKVSFSADRGDGAGA
jgi:type IV secretion system protein VirB4